MDTAKLMYGKAERARTRLVTSVSRWICVTALSPTNVTVAERVLFGGMSPPLGKRCVTSNSDGMPFGLTVMTYLVTAVTGARAMNVPSTRSPTRVYESMATVSLPSRTTYAPDSAADGVGRLVA